MLLTGVLPIVELYAIDNFLVDRFWVYLLYALTILPFQMIAAYLIAYFIAPKFILKKKYMWSIILIISSAYILSVLLRITMVHIIEPIVRTPPLFKESIIEIITDLPHLLFKYSIRIYQAVFVFLLIKYFIEYKNQKQKNLILEKSKIEIELNMLKMQLNPHFLFNTFNNIYSLALMKSEETPIAIERLSKILEYTIYDGAKKYVPIIKEMEQIENLIELQRLRNPSFELRIEKNLKDNLQVSPLLLLSLVENAFKHWGSKSGRNPVLCITIQCSDRKLFFKIWNTKGSIQNKEPKKNLGNRNLVKQLQLSYPLKHDLKFEELKDTYCVKLMIDTNL